MSALTVMVAVMLLLHARTIPVVTHAETALLVTPVVDLLAAVMLMNVQLPMEIAIASLSVKTPRDPTVALAARPVTLVTVQLSTVA